MLPDPDAEPRHDVTEAVKVLLRALAFTDYLGLDSEEAERRLDEWERTEAERRAQRAKAARQLAAEMRAADPALVRAGWTDAELVELRRMRNLGLA